jgi:hypothetical protein
VAAVAIHRAASSQPCLTESVPANMAAMNPPETTLFMVCMSMASRTLPFVLLNSQAKTTAHPKRNIGSVAGIFPVTRSGRCHKASPPPSHSAAASADRALCSLGCA